MATLYEADRCPYGTRVRAVVALPWVLRAHTRLGRDLESVTGLAARVERLAERPAVAPGLELAAAA